MGVIYGNGVTQDDLATLLKLIETKWNAVLTKLDADTGVADTNYKSTRGVTLSTNVQGNGMNLDDVYSFLAAVRISFNAVMTKLDSDGQVADTDYSSGKALGAFANMYSNGILQGVLVNTINTILTSINAVNAKLDLDGGVVGTNYAATCNVADTVDETFTTSI